MRPDQQNALCIYWRGKVIVDLALCFGLSSSAGIFGSIADMLVALYKAYGYGPIRKWVDDFFVIRLLHQSYTEQDFIATLGAAGVPWSIPKTRSFATRQRFTGFIWDLERRSVSMPSEKMEQTRNLIDTWLAMGHKATMKEAAHLHGKLIHIATIFPLIRPFTRTIAMFAARFRSPRAKLRCPDPVQADLRWTRQLLDKLPNEMPLTRPEPADIGWWGDASSSFGIGVVVGPFWGIWRYARGVEVGPRKQYDIGWAEALAVEVGLQMAEQHGVLARAQTIAGRILVRSDNEGIVTVVNHGRSRSANTNEVLRRIYSTLANTGITLRATHVPSRLNVTDALSRGDIEGFLAGFAAATTRSDFCLPPNLASLLSSP